MRNPAITVRGPDVALGVADDQLLPIIDADLLQGCGFYYDIVLAIA
jgi:hypothetical protein